MGSFSVGPGSEVVGNSFTTDWDATHVQTSGDVIKPAVVVGEVMLGTLLHQLESVL